MKPNYLPRPIVQFWVSLGLLLLRDEVCIPGGDPLGCPAGPPDWASLWLCLCTSRFWIIDQKSHKAGNAQFANFILYSSLLLNLEIIVICFLWVDLLYFSKIHV